MLTDNQASLVSQLVDLNWESSFNDDPRIREESETEFFKVKAQLIQDMGVKAYMEFMEMGARMFS